MTYDYIDIHSHLYFPDFDYDREDVISKMKKEKIAAITVGVDFDSSDRAIQLAEKHQNLFATVGQHPGDVMSKTVFDIRLAGLASKLKVIAIGECGLDYFREAAEDLKLREVQKVIFQKHINLALQKGLPLMLHIRPSKGSQDAYLDALQILEGKNTRGNVHFFAGDLDVLKRFLDIGFFVSFTGVITFIRDYDELVKYVPRDRIMSETDSPLVAPLPYRGKRNSPLYVPEVVKKIACIRGEDVETVEDELLANARNMFNINI